MVLGGLAAVVLLSLPGGSPTSHRGPASSGQGLSASSPATQLSAAAQQACLADFQTLSDAMTEYQVEHGVLPASVAQLQPLVRGSLSSGGFSLLIDPAHPGRLEVQTPGHPATAGSGNCRYA